jgi:hypothetical protein
LFAQLAAVPVQAQTQFIVEAGQFPQAQDERILGAHLGKTVLVG